jgi:hypothetical protein
MAVTNVAAVQSHIMSEILGNVLAPLFRKYVMLQFLNRSNIDGDASLKRKIPVQDAIAAAYPDIEGAALGVAETMPYLSAIELTPVGYGQLIELTIKAIRRRMPGATRDQVIAAIASGSPESLPIVQDAVALSIDAHLRAAEAAVGGLATSISRTAGATNTTLSIATILDAQTKLLNGDTTSVVSGKPAHEEMVLVVDEIGVGHLRTLLAGGTGAALSGLWANPQTDLSIFNLAPDTSRTGLRGGVAGTAIYAADSAAMVTTATDINGMLILVGRGETGAPGSQRGFAEFCEGHAPSVEFERDARSDILSVPSRWEWVVGEHTDLHAVRVLYRKT